MKKDEFKKILRTAGFSTQAEFAELVGVKATTFSTYKTVPSHIVRIAKLSLLALDNGATLEEVKHKLKS